MDNGIIFAEDLPDSTLDDRVSRGDLIRLVRGIYTTDVEADPGDVVRRSWREIQLLDPATDDPAIATGRPS